MIWLWGFVIFFIVLMAISLGIGYAINVRMIGREAAQRDLRKLIPELLFSFLTCFLIVLLIEWLGKYGLVSVNTFYVSVNTLCAFYINVWLLSWFFRKKESGVLLLDVGRTPQNKPMFIFGLLELVALCLQTWLFFERLLRGFPQYISFSREVSTLAFFWSCAILLVAIGLSKLEFRENGICYMYSFTAWQRIKSYNWEPSKPNILTIRFKPRFPLLPKFMSITIPAQHQNAVSHILDERLPDKNL